MVEEEGYRPLNPDELPMPCGGDEIVYPDRDGRRMLCINPELREKVVGLTLENDGDDSDSDDDEDSDMDNEKGDKEKDS